MNQESEFAKELAAVINRHGKENGSNTPDFILAQYMNTCLIAFNVAARQREDWYGINLRPADRAALSPTPSEVER